MAHLSTRCLMSETYLIGYIVLAKNFEGHNSFIWATLKESEAETLEAWDSLNTIFRGHIPSDAFIKVTKIRIRYVKEGETYTEANIQLHAYVFATSIVDEAEPKRFADINRICRTIEDSDSLWADYALLYDGEISRNCNVLIAEILETET